MRSKQSILDIEGTITNDTYNYFTKKVKTRQEGFMNTYIFDNNQDKTNEKIQ